MGMDDPSESVPGRVDVGGDGGGTGGQGGGKSESITSSGLSVRVTWDTHVKGPHSKLGISDRVQLVPRVLTKVLQGSGWGGEPWIELNS